MALPCTLRGHTALLFKMTHLIPTNLEETARLYVDHVVKLHGVPQATVSDCDKRFTGQFSTTLLEIIGISNQPHFPNCFGFHKDICTIAFNHNKPAIHPNDSFAPHVSHHVS
eukprot:1109717-Pelagomonas_calceolata.AAC.2